jgi:hypothetical protein
VKQKLLSEEKGFSGHPMAKLFSMARKLTGENEYDSLVARYGSHIVNMNHRQHR